MNAEKLSKLQSQVRIGGKGTARRKKKVVHRTATTDDKKLQSALKKLTVNAIPGIEQVDMYKDDDMVIHFVNPKVQASLAANTFAITGQGETRPLKDTPEAIPLMGSGSIEQLSKLFAQGLGGQGGVAGNSALNEMAAQLSAGGLGALDGAAAAAAALGSVKEEEDDEVPQLVQNFDEAAKIKEN